jgi:hypothetical protein
MNGASITRRIFAVPELKTIRQTILERDYGNNSPSNGANNQEIDYMFQEFADLTQEGETAQDALADVFGLEPDYLFDGELQQYYNGKGE